MSEVDNLGVTATASYDVVIVGAGHAGVSVATNLVKGGYSGSIALISDEPQLPYKRPPLSKGYLMGTESEEDLQLRSADYWTRSSVALMRATRVVAVAPQSRAVTTDNGAVVEYEYLVWAAGGRARSLPIPGTNTNGVHQVRTMADVAALKHDLSSARRALIVGGGYIGLETAAVFRGLGLEVTIVEAADRVLERVTSPPVSKYLQQVHGAAGVDIRVGRGVQQISGQAGALTVVLTDGEEHAADLVVVAVGLEPNHELLVDAAVSCSVAGVEVDDFCRTSVPRIYAVGDCTTQVRAFGATQARMRLESVQNANDQGKVVASDLLGVAAVNTEVPWFWSDQYDVKLKTAGLIGGYDELVIRGDQATGCFTVCYLAEERLVAVDCINSPRDFAMAKTLIKQGVWVDRTALSDLSRPLGADAVTA